MAFPLRSFFLLCAISGVLSGGWNQNPFFQDDSCPKGWLRLGSKCYIYKPDSRIFTDAEKVCQTLGGNLVSIHNIVENAVVLDLIRQGVNFDVAWIGLQDAITSYFSGVIISQFLNVDSFKCNFVFQDNEFFWTDGTLVNFFSFGPGEPDSNGNCILMFKGDGFWKDDLCNLEYPYVCIQDAKFCRGYGYGW
ncbi:galactose-specific lectin nattectin-like [Festucalex cinctus]